MTSATNARKALMVVDPHCWWCGIYLIEMDNLNEIGANATLDHLNTRNTPTGQRRTPKPGAMLYVLACAPCNAIRGRISTALYQAGLSSPNEVSLQEAIEIQQKSLQGHETLAVGDKVRVRLKTGTVLSELYIITKHLPQFDTWAIKNEASGYETYARTKYLVKETDTDTRK